MKSIYRLYRVSFILVTILLMGNTIFAQSAQNSATLNNSGRYNASQVSKVIKGTGQVMPDGFSTIGLQGMDIAGSVDFGSGRSTDTLWTKNFGGEMKDECYSVCQTSDGGYIMVGRSNSLGAGDMDGWMIKTDENGGMEWMQTYGDSYIDEAYQVKQTSDGGFIIAGMSTAFGNAGEGWLIKTDSEGNVLWNNGYHPASGANPTGWDYIYDVIETGTGDFVAFGYAAMQENLLQAWIMKIDAAGNRLWEKLYGEEYWERLFSADMTGDGGFIAVGDKHYTYNDTIYKHDGWLVRFDENGDTLWTNHFGADQIDIFRSVKVASDGGFIISGERELNETTGYYGWMVKTDSEGHEIWNTTSTTSGGLMAVWQAEDGNYIAAGTSNRQGTLYDGWLVKADQKGSVMWEKFIAGSNLDDMFLSMNKTDDGSYILGGKFNSQEFGDYWLVKLAPESVDPLTYFFENFDEMTPPDLPEYWSGQMDVLLSNTFAEVKSMAHGSAPSQPNATFIMNGLNGSNGQLDSAAFVALVTPLVSIGENGARLTFSGNGGNAIQVGTMLDPGDASTFVLAQEFPLTYDFVEYSVILNEPGITYLALKHANTNTTTPLFIDNILFEQVSTVGIPETNGDDLKIFPNPASGYVNIAATREISNLQVVNYYGGIVYRNTEMHRNNFLLEIGNFAAGNYLVRVVTTDGRSFTRKLQIIH